MRFRISPILLLLLASSLLLVGACAEKTPEQKLVEARAKYTATLGGWSAVEPPAEETASPMIEEDEAMEEAGEVAVEEAEGEVAEGEASEEEMPEETLAEEAAPELKTVLLDILIRNENQEKLPGITLDVSQANETGDEIAHWRIWVDTSSIERGPGTQIDYRIENVEIVEGYGFHVEVRSPVPAEDRGEYREFADLP